MKVKATIEEVISQTFEVEVSSIDDAYDEIQEMYKSGKLVVENPTLTEANLMVTTDEEDFVEGCWTNLHI